MTQFAPVLALLENPVWFCLRAEPKREHLAAGIVSQTGLANHPIASVRVEDVRELTGTLDSITEAQNAFLGVGSKTSPIQRSIEKSEPDAPPNSTSIHR